MTFANDRLSSLTSEPYSLAANFFLQQGHLALSFDLPHHGSQQHTYGEGITGFRNAFVAGNDSFQQFVDQGRTVIEWCIAQGIASPERIVTCGTSRGGYMALRLLAEDSRIIAGAGFAPVTDWRDLSEFEQDRTCDDVAALRLSNHAEALASKSVFMVIGNHDQRVNTASCCQLYLDILKAAQSKAENKHLDFYCTEDPGHSCSPAWYQKGAGFLLNSGGMI
jgi:dienelactone hydrolase